MTDIKLGRRRSLLGTSAVVISAALPANSPKAADATAPAAATTTTAATTTAATSSVATATSAALAGKGKLKIRPPKPTSIKDYGNNPFLRPIGPVLNSSDQARLKATASEVKGGAVN